MADKTTTQENAAATIQDADIFRGVQNGSPVKFSYAQVKAWILAWLATSTINLVGAIASASVQSPIYKSSGAVSFQSNGSTVGGTLTAGQKWGFGSALGALTPTNTTVVISQNAAVVDAATPGLVPLLHLVSPNGSIGSIIIDGFASLPAVGFRRADGTAAVPSVQASGSVLGSFFALGFDGSVNKYGYGGEIDFIASEIWSATAHGSGYTFYTVANTTTTQVASMSLKNSGCLVIGSGGNDNGAGNITATNGIQPGSFTVAGLPAGVTGKTVMCTNARVFNGAGVQEGAAAGTGGLVSYNGTAWKLVGTNTTAVA